MAGSVTTGSGVIRQTAESTRIGYRRGSVVVDVETADADTNRWLAEFLSPWVDVVPYGVGSAAVCLAFSAPTYDALERRRSEPAHPKVACFALDGHTVELPAWRDAEDLVIADVDGGCFYRVRDRSVDIVARPGHRRHRIGLMRVVREILVAPECSRDSVVDLHAAAFAARRGAVVIAGAKRAGKTTLLAHALSSGGVSLVANDRVLVDVSSHQPEVVGIPTFVSIRADTLRLFPALRRSAAERPAILHAGELRVDGVCLPADDLARHGFTLSPAQFAERLGAVHTRRARLAAIVFPEICAAVDSWRLESLHGAERVELLGQSLYGARVAGERQTVFGGLARATSRAANQATTAERFLAHVPFLRCRLGPEAYHAGGAAWLRSLDSHLAESRHDA